MADLKIPQELYDDLIAHAQADAPNECCGMVGGKDGTATTVYRASNAEGSPLRYNLDPSDQIKMMTAMEKAGEDLAAIYHSHTVSEAYPSQTDINLAAYPDSVYLIVSLMDGADPLRGFWIRDGKVEEAEIELG